MTPLLIRVQHFWAVLCRNEARALALLEILIMLDTTALKANAAAAVAALAQAKTDKAADVATIADLTSKLAAATADEQVSQADVTSVSDQLAAAVAPAEQPAN